MAGLSLVKLLLAIFATVVVDGKRPNFLILFADDMGYGDMSANGAPTILTPRLDQLSREGTRFTQWYSGFHICSPSRAAMLTGRLPIRSGMAGSHWMGDVLMANAVGGLPENETTFADVLKAEGYASLAIGKWHLGQQHKYLPTSRGFDEYFGIPYSVDMGYSAWSNDTSELKTTQSLPLMHNTTVIEQPANLNTLDQRYVDKAAEFIRTQTAAEKPFLLYLAWNHVHVPDYASPEFCNKSLRGRFGDAMQELDSSIGKVLDVLKDVGADEDTVVFFTSDNGPWIAMGLEGGSAGPFFEGKQTSWEGGYRVPGVIRWPGKVAAQHVSTEIVTTYDIFPTMVALAGGTMPQDRVIDGKDLSGVLFRGETDPDRCIFMYQGTPSLGLPPRSDDPEPGLWAIRCGRYKAHFYTHCSVMWATGDGRCNTDSSARKQDPPLLFNVDRDVSEMWPIKSETAEYKSAMAVILDAQRSHEATLTPVQNQNARGQDQSLGVCCNDDLKSLSHRFWQSREVGQLPRCTCNPENFRVHVCAPVCVRPWFCVEPGADSVVTAGNFERTRDLTI